MTRHGLHGGPRGEYGRFLDKVKQGIYTRHSLHLGPRSLYGSFEGKVSGTVPTLNIHGRTKSPAAQQRYKTSKAQGIYLNKG